MYIACTSNSTKLNGEGGLDDWDETVGQKFLFRRSSRWPLQMCPSGGLLMPGQSLGKKREGDGCA